MIQLILSSRQKLGLSLGSMIMVGRQNLHLQAKDLEECLQNFNYTDYEIQNIHNQTKCFADDLFTYLGAKDVQSIDASDFEDATIIQDMNFPLGESVGKNCFNFVLDSGTLEHVFNFPQAIKNCLELVKTGGHFVGIYPCNNFFGHGFYQFSSELFYRIFSEENGFEVVDVILFVDEPNTTFYNVPDTTAKYQRIQFTNKKPVYIYVVAKKNDTVEIFKNYPLQMDYAEIKWKGLNNDIPPKRKKKTLKDYVPTYYKQLVRALLNRPYNDSTSFKKPYFTTYQLK